MYTHILSPDRIVEIIEKIRRSRVAIYGDFCLDGYWFVDPEGSEISVETGLQAQSVTSQRYSPGGAGNIAVNLAALNPDMIAVIGCVGDDIFGRELSQQLSTLDIDITHLHIQKEDFDTYTFIKQHIDQKEIPRIDFGVENKKTIASEKLLLENIRLELNNCDAFIFNQQIDGSLSSDFIREFNKLIPAHPDKIILLDSRHYNDAFHHVYLKSNITEIARLNDLQYSIPGQISLEQVGKWGLNIYQGKPIFITCGHRGMLVIDQEKVIHIPGIELLDKVDPVGAGDTATSALAVSLAAGIFPADAAFFANLAASVTVQKRWTTGSATGVEISQQAQKARYVFNADINPEQINAKKIPRIGNHFLIKTTKPVRQIIFDHDGTISLLRRDWQRLMENTMMNAICGRHYGGSDVEHIRQEVIEYIDKSTGIQTILQMEHLVKMVLKHALVAQDRVLDKFAYKEIYNDSLLKMVNNRIAELEKDPALKEQYLVPGVVPFLTRMSELGYQLYLASGTDIQDVINEATLLGYHQVFIGGIFGSVNNVKQYSKQQLIAKIVDDHRLSAGELAIFGDGPVEILEGKRWRAKTFGIVGDESEFGKIDKSKYKRLVQAGADYIILDFTKLNQLLSLF